MDEFLGMMWGINICMFLTIGTNRWLILFIAWLIALVLWLITFRRD